MQDVSKTILSSDFDTLKNEAIITTTVVKPSNATVAGGARAVWSTDVNVGSTPIDNTYFRYTGDDGTYKILAVQQATIDRSGSSPGPYSLLVSAYYINSTTIRYQIEAFNPYNTTLNTGSALTATFRSAMYSDPFV